MKKKALLITRESALQKVEECGGSARQAAKALGIPKSTFYDVLNGRYPSVRSNISRFVITYGQNDTPVHQGFFWSLQKYCARHKAELIVYKGTYRNPTSPFEQLLQQPQWAKDIRPFLLDSERRLNNNLVIFPCRTQPTAIRPLSGFDTHTAHRSGIFPHPKVQLKTVPTLHGLLPKILTTTGAITVKNYSDSKAGKKGEHHHILGACVVEVENEDRFYLRHINATQDGAFYDIVGGTVRHYSPTGIKTVKQLDTYVSGDWHSPYLDEEAVAGMEDLLEKNKCKRLVVHDGLDFYRQNHHTRHDRFLNSAKQTYQDVLVEEEVNTFIKHLVRHSHPERELLIVPSNHNDALFRWLREADINTLGVNAMYFHYLSWQVHKASVKTPSGYWFPDPLRLAVQDKIGLQKYNIRFLKRDVAEIHLDIAYHLHGDVGPNGAKGSPLNLSKIGVKTVIGHGHAPAIVDGCYMVGVKSLIPLNYAKDAPGGWMHTDSLTYPDGKRTLVHFIKGQCYLAE